MNGYLGRLIARAHAQPPPKAPRPLSDPFENVESGLPPPTAHAAVDAVPAAPPAAKPSEAPPAPIEHRTTVERVERIERVESHIERETVERGIPEQQRDAAREARPAAPPRAAEAPPAPAPERVVEAQPKTEAPEPLAPDSPAEMPREIERTIERLTERTATEIPPVRETIERRVQIDKPVERAAPVPTIAPPSRLAAPAPELRQTPQQPTLSIGRVLVDIVPAQPAPLPASHRPVRATRARFDREPAARFGLGQM